MQSFFACLIFASMLPAVAFAEEWNNTDKLLVAGVEASLAIDWWQTRRIAASNGGYYETNAILGRHPSGAEVNRYFIASMALIPLAADLLPPTYRRALLGGTLALEIYVTSRNRGIVAKIALEK
jgi:hypothetical protein